MTPIINIADLTDRTDPQGRTFRQINAAKAHCIAVGTLVEIEGGARMFVVYQGRDCDQTPLYWLSPDKDNVEIRQPGFMNFGWHGGYAEESLKPIHFEHGE